MAAGDDLDSFLAPCLDEPVHLLPVRLGDERAHLGLLVERVAGLHAAGSLREAADDLVVERPLDEDARACVAALAGGVVDRVDGTRDRRFEVRVRKEDVRALAAQLERDSLHRLGAEPHDLRARPRRARERDLVHAAVGDEVRAGRRAVARDDVDHARGDADLDCELGEAQRGERRGGVGLEDDRAASGERGRQLPGGHHEGVVPGDDLGYDADRLLQGVGEDGATHRHRAAGDRRNGGGVPAEVLGRDGHLAFHRGHSLADVARLELGQLLAVSDDRVGESVDEAGALVRRSLRPRALESGARGLDGPVHVCRRSHRRAPERRSGRGLLELTGFLRLDGLSLDEEAVVLGRDRHQFPPSRSKMAACPWPTPTQSVASP